MTGYLELDDALYLVNRLGFHVRDLGLLGSALARPATTLFGDDAYLRLEDKAAALLQSLARNHALLDGNERTAWTLTIEFLWINGHCHDFGTDEAFDLVIGVATGGLDVPEIADRLRVHLIPR